MDDDYVMVPGRELERMLEEVREMRELLRDS